MQCDNAVTRRSPSREPRPESPLAHPRPDRPAEVRRHCLPGARRAWL